MYISPDLPLVSMGPHTKERYQSLHGTDDEKIIQEHVLSGTIIDAKIANALCGRNQQETRGIYVLCKTRKGIFVLADRASDPELTCNFFIITYLRLYSRYCAFTLEKWPLETSLLFSETLEEKETQYNLKNIIPYRVSPSAAVRNYYLTVPALRKALERSQVLETWKENGSLGWIIHDESAGKTLKVSFHLEMKTTRVENFPFSLENPKPDHQILTKFMTPDKQVFGRKQDAQKHMEVLKARGQVVRGWFQGKTKSFDCNSLVEVMTLHGDELAALLDHFNGSQGGK